MRTISLRGARADRGLNQTQVAEALGVSLATYSVIERDPSRITWAQAVKLAALFGREVEEFSFHTPHELERVFEQLEEAPDDDPDAA